MLTYRFVVVVVLRLFRQQSSSPTTAGNPLLLVLPLFRQRYLVSLGMLLGYRELHEYLDLAAETGLFQYRESGMRYVVSYVLLSRPVHCSLSLCLLRTFNCLALVRRVHPRARSRLSAREAPNANLQPTSFLHLPFSHHHHLTRSLLYSRQRVRQGRCKSQIARRFITSPILYRKASTMPRKLPYSRMRQWLRCSRQYT